MVFDEMVLPICDQGYLIVREAVVSSSLLVDGILCSFVSDDLFLSNVHSTGNFDRHYWRDTMVRFEC